MLRRSLCTAITLTFAALPAGCSDNSPPGVGGASTSTTDGSAEGAASTMDASASTPMDASPDAASTTLSFFAAGATQAPVTAALPGFAAQNGLTINLTFGSAGSLRDQILTGTSGADVAIVTPSVVTALNAKSLVYPGSPVTLGQVAGGVAVRAADVSPDISDSDKLKAALLAADEIYYADPTLATAGAAFIAICNSLGIATTCAAAPAGKGHTAPEGSGAMTAMALSDAGTVIGAAQVSEIKAATGVKLVGEYPSTPIDLRVETVYTAIIVQGTPNLANAQLLLQFLSGPTFETELGVFGFEPVADP